MDESVAETKVALIKHGLYALSEINPRERIPVSAVLNHLLLLFQRPLAITIIRPDGDRWRRESYSVCDPAIQPFFNAVLENRDLIRPNTLEVSQSLPGSDRRVFLHMIAIASDGKPESATLLDQNSPDFQLLGRFLTSVGSDPLFQQNPIIETVFNLEGRDQRNGCDFAPPPIDEAQEDLELEAAHDAIRSEINSLYADIKDAPILRDVNDPAGRSAELPYPNIFFFLKTASHGRAGGRIWNFPYGLRLVIPNGQKEEIVGALDAIREREAKQGRCAQCGDAPCPIRSKDTLELFRILERPFGHAARHVVDSSLISGLFDFSSEIKGQGRSAPCPEADVDDHIRARILVCLFRQLTAGAPAFLASCPVTVEQTPFLVCCAITHDKTTGTKPYRSWLYNYHFCTTLVGQQLSRKLWFRIWNSYRSQIREIIVRHLDGDSGDNLEQINRKMTTLSKAFPFDRIELHRDRREKSTFLNVAGGHLWMSVHPNSYFPRFAGDLTPRERFIRLVSTVVADFNDSVRSFTFDAHSLLGNNAPNFEKVVAAAMCKNKHLLVVHGPEGGESHIRTRTRLRRYVAEVLGHYSEHGRGPLETFDFLDVNADSYSDEEFFRGISTDAKVVMFPGSDASIFSRAKGGVLLLIGVFEKPHAFQERVALAIDTCSAYDLRIVFASRRPIRQLRRDANVYKKLLAILAQIPADMPWPPEIVGQWAKREGFDP